MAKKNLRGLTPRLGPEQSFPAKTASLTATKVPLTLGSSLHMHGLIFESDPIFPKTPRNTFPVSGQHIPSLRIEI